MDREKNTDLFFSANNIEYVLNFIREIYALKHNKTHMPFPDFVNNIQQFIISLLTIFLNLPNTLVNATH